jgi:endonuclease/exonuclease/phosphatase family metal-dependent hydrolase
MATPLRIASFNVENFFSRAALLNGDNAEAKPRLEALARLHVELAKADYDAAAILPAWALIEDDVVIRENKGKLFRKSGGKLVVVPKGRKDWEGWIELKRERIPAVGQDNTARVVRAANADIQAVVEMEDRVTLSRLGRSPLLGAGRYPHAMLVDGNDDRGIDVGVLSRHAISTVRSNVDARDSKGQVFSRDCLEVRVDLPSGKPVYVLVNHLKSQGYGTPASNNAKRLRQSAYIRDVVLARYNLDKDFVVIAGDFNADPSGPNRSSIAPLVEHVKLVDVVAEKLPAADCWTYGASASRKERLDFLLCSKALAKRCTGAGIERRGMWQLGKLTAGAQQPFATVTSQATSASDHAAVFADFKLD